MRRVLEAAPNPTKVPVSGRSRWAKSQVTFGPAGRLVATAATFLPILWFLYYAGPFGVMSAAIWMVCAVPWALHDIWQAVKRPATAQELIAAAFESQAASGFGDEHVPIDQRVPPTRW